MTKQGKYNLLAALLLPAAAALGVKLAAMNGVWNPITGSLHPLENTYVFIALQNFGIMLVALLITGILLLRSSGEKARWLAILPSVVTALFGAGWYLFRGVIPAEVAAGAEYVGAPQYLVVALLGATVLVLFLRVTRIAPRTS